MPHLHYNEAESITQRRFGNLRELRWQSKASLLMDLKPADKNLTTGTSPFWLQPGSRTPEFSLEPFGVTLTCVQNHAGAGCPAMLGIRAAASIYPPETFRAAGPSASWSTEGFVFPESLSASGMLHLILCKAQMRFQTRRE